MKRFKHGDRVRMRYQHDYVHGEVTIANSETQIKGCLSSKVMFDEEWAPDYWYYPNEDLELISRKGA